MGNARDTGYLQNIVTYDANDNIVLPANLNVGGAAIFSSSVTVSSLIKSGGTSSQFLKADGSVDSNTYLTTGTASSTYLPLAGGTLTGALTGTSASFSGKVSLNLLSIGGTRELQFSYFNATNAKTIIRVTGTSDFRQHLDILMNTAQSDSAPTQVVRIANSGAATFSSSVTSEFFGFNALSAYGFTSYDGSSASGKSINFSTGYYNGLDAIFQSAGNTNDFGIWTNGGSSTQAKLMIKNGGNVGIGTVNPSTQLNVGHENHGLGFAYIGSSALPSIAGLFTDTGANGGQGYGSLQIKSRSDYAGYSINFFTAAFSNTPVERMRITAEGSVGIGTDIPAARLQLNLTNAFPGTVLASSSIGNVGNNFSIITTDAQDQNVGGMITFGGMRNSDATNVGIFGGIRGGKENNTSGNTSGTLGFYTLQSAVAFAERMRITSGGNVLIGTTTDTGAKLNVGGSYQSFPLSIEAMTGGNQLALTRVGAVAEFYMGGSTGATTQLYVRSGGSGGVLLSTGSTGWVSASDIRLKDIEKPIENAVESLSTLQTVYYSWKDSEDKSLHIGFIAQEVEEVFPEVVTESSIDGMKGVKYTELIPVLVAAIKELKVENNLLKDRLDKNNIN
jgi:hypothetical protein